MPFLVAGRHLNEANSMAFEPDFPVRVDVEEVWEIGVGFHPFLSFGGTVYCTVGRSQTVASQPPQFSKHVCGTAAEDGQQMTLSQAVRRVARVVGRRPV